MVVEATGLIDRALDLKPARRGVGGGGPGPLLGRLEPPLAQTERIPVDAEAPAEHEQDDEPGERRQTQAHGRQGAQDQPRVHGKAFRSSSKCGPSRRVGQSPPQTRAVPCRAAAALKAAAMRGYRGQSQRTWPSTRAATSMA